MACNLSVQSKVIKLSSVKNLAYLLKKSTLLSALPVVIVGLTTFYFCTTSSITPDEISKPYRIDKEEEDKHSMQTARAAHDFKMEANPITKEIPRGIKQLAYQAAKKAPVFGSLNKDFSGITVEERGPNNLGGRTRALAFDIRSTASDFANGIGIGLAGGVSGGIFRSTSVSTSTAPADITLNNTTTEWAPVTDPGQIHNVSCIVQDRSSGNNDIWYAGSGEQSSNSLDLPGSPYYGTGIWKSTNNGIDWTLLPTTNSALQDFDNAFDYVHRMVVDPTNGDVYAGNAGGVFRSTDGGATWNGVLEPLGVGFISSTLITEIIYSNGVFYAAMNEFGIYKSTNGTSWTQIATPAQLEQTSANTLGRIVLAASKSTPDIVYALYLGESFNCNGGQSSNVYLKRYNNASNTLDGDWKDDISVCNNPALQLDLQDGYNMVIAVKPDNKDIVFIGGERLYRFAVTNATTGVYKFAAGDQRTPAINRMHVDQHLLVFDENNPDIAWAANDGGIRFGNVAGEPDPTSGYNFHMRNYEYITYQFYRGDITPDVSSNMIGGGVQDNSCNIVGATGGGNGKMGFELGGGDGGGFAFISGTNTENYNTLTATQNGTLFRRTRTGGGAETEIYITPYEENDPADGQYQGFSTYILLDADNRDYLYYPVAPDNPLGNGTTNSSLMRTRISTTINEDNATNITGDADTGWEEMNINIGTEEITAMAVTRGAGYNASNSNRKLYFGTDLGYIYRISDPAFGNGTQVQIGDQLVNGGYISAIAINPVDDKEILVTVSNYNVSSVFHTLDATATNPVWTEVEGPAAGAVATSSVRSAMIVKSTGAGNPSFYIVGTTTGLYGTLSLNGASTIWMKISPDLLAQTPCADMRLRTADNKIALASHGNGLFLLTVGEVEVSGLPIELTAFTAILKGKNAQLNWSTATERDNKGFEVQHSNDGKDFNKIGWIDGAGTTTTPQRYQFTHSTLINGKNYYRLKEVSNNGIFNYSEVKVLDINQPISTILYPNPAKRGTNLTLAIDAILDKELNASIYNMKGQLVATHAISVKAGNQSFIIPTQSLTKGTYFIRIDNHTSLRFTITE